MFCERPIKSSDDRPRAVEPISRGVFQRDVLKLPDPRSSPYTTQAQDQDQDQDQRKSRPTCKVQGQNVECLATMSAGCALT